MWLVLRWAGLIGRHKPAKVSMRIPLQRWVTRSRLPGLLGLWLFLLLLFTGCSVRKMALRSVAGSFDDALTAYTRDDDPEFVRNAMPASLKMIEILITESPENVTLLQTAASGFTMYSHAFLVQRADRVELEDVAGARELRTRGKQMFLRARDYGLRALEAEYPGFRDQLEANTGAALQRVSEADIPLVYWTAAPWGSAIGLDTDDYELVMDIPVVGKMIERCLELDETWGGGRLHEFMMAYEANRRGMGGSLEEAERHYLRALELNQGQSAALFVSAAEALAVPRQNRSRFKSLLQKALEVNVEDNPDMRLLNVMAQNRARWLLDHTDHYFY